MKRIFVTAFAGAVALAGAAHAGGDAAAGEKTFRKCKSCHSITAPDGTAIVKGGKVGPNLYGVVGRTAGTLEGYKYGDSLKAAGAAGLVWTEEEIVRWLADPKAFLREYLGDSGARTKMTFRLKKGGEDVAAYLASIAPAQ